MIPATPKVLATYFNVHLISDATGETLNALMRAASAQFDNVQPIEHNYYLVRSKRQLDRVIKQISDLPGTVWHTVTDIELRTQLEVFCKSKNIPILGALDASIMLMSRHLGVVPAGNVAGQHNLNAEYFNRISAIDFALAHDDGQNVATLGSADVILLGVSRTSKTPTCVYLANRGVKAGNIPLVPQIAPPDALFTMKGPAIFGLKLSIDYLMEIRKSRLRSLDADGSSDYVDVDAVRAEILFANRLFEQLDVPVIDVSRRSVEETAALVLNRLNAQRRV